MNLVEYKPMIYISLICLGYCAFWAIVYMIINKIRNKNEN